VVHSVELAVKVDLVRRVMIIKKNGKGKKDTHRLFAGRDE